MRKIGSRLMDVPPSMRPLELGSNRFQLSLIDSYAGHAALLAEYQHKPGNSFEQPAAI